MSAAAAVENGNDEAFDYFIADMLKGVPENALLGVGGWMLKRHRDHLLRQELYVMLRRIPFTPGWTLALSKIITRYYRGTPLKATDDETLIVQMADRIRRVYAMRGDKDSLVPWFILGGAPGSGHAEDFLAFMEAQPMLPTPLVLRALRLVKEDADVATYDKRVMIHLQERGIL